MLSQAWVKSVSPSLAHELSLTPQVHCPLSLLPQAHAEAAGGWEFSVDAFSQLHCWAACLPQEQVEFWAHTHWGAEQGILGMGRQRAGPRPALYTWWLQAHAARPAYLSRWRLSCRSRRPIIARTFVMLTRRAAWACMHTTNGSADPRGANCHCSLSLARRLAIGDPLAAVSEALQPIPKTVAFCEITWLEVRAGCAPICPGNLDWLIVPSYALQAVSQLFRWRRRSSA